MERFPLRRSRGSIHSGILRASRLLNRHISFEPDVPGTKLCQHTVRCCVARVMAVPVSVCPLTTLHPRQTAQTRHAP